MQEVELKKLLKLTAIELEPSQVLVFLEYFTGMRKMFDEFVETAPLLKEGSEAGGSNSLYLSTSPTPPYEGGWCFVEGEEFGNVKGILANVDEKRLVGNAIEVKSAFGE